MKTHLLFYINYKRLLPLAHTTEDSAFLLLTVLVTGLYLFFTNTYFFTNIIQGLCGGLLDLTFNLTCLFFFKLNWILFCATLWSLRPTLANMKSDVSQSKDTRYNNISQTLHNVHFSAFDSLMQTHNLTFISREKGHF